jgi:hypothetical protein
MGCGVLGQGQTAGFEEELIGISYLADVGSAKGNNDPVDQAGRDDAEEI